MADGLEIIINIEERRQSIDGHAMAFEKVEFEYDVNMLR
jgi:hypothetical protein